MRMSLSALHIYAGPKALQHVRRHGLQPQDVHTLAGAAGGPKGLMLNHLDQFIFGDWLARQAHQVDLVGASVGAWRMAAACMPNPVAALQQLAHDYVHQRWAEDKSNPKPEAVSAVYAEQLHRMFDGHVQEVLHHPYWRLHLVVSQGRGILRRATPLRTALGYGGAYIANAMRRQAMGRCLQRLVFSSQEVAPPFAMHDYRSLQVPLRENNFFDALQASGSIPFVLAAVQNIAGAPAGACWDGGITDYHLHLAYQGEGIVLYPHFQKEVIPGWLDKAWKRRHRSTPFLDNVLLLAPNPAWVATLPNGKLPDRNDFQRYRYDNAGRIAAWKTAISASQQMVEEFAQWLRQPDASRVQSL